LTKLSRTGDLDNDGLTDLAEYERASDPTKADTDGDGLNDGAEVTAGTNPLSTDTDGDGFRDTWQRYGSVNMNQTLNKKLTL
jgi:hypothetical protein